MCLFAVGRTSGLLDCITLLYFSYLRKGDYREKQ